jgi:hypothetical protein
MKKRTITSFMVASVVAAVCLTSGMSNNVQAASGKKIVWVSFHPGDGTPSGAAAAAGFTQAPDVEYTRLLASAGHQVTRYVSTATPDVTFLNSFDLVIISRSVPSGHYQNSPSPELWHSVNSPTMLLGGYILRANRLGYTVGNTIPDTAGTIQLTVHDMAHKIFTGVALDAGGTMVNPFAHRVTYNGILQRGISVNTDFPVDGATLLASVGTAGDPAFGGMIIAEYPSGTVMANATADTTAGKRLVFLTGSREQSITAEGAGIFDLDPDGVRLFLNAVNYMLGLEVTEPPPQVTNLRPAPGAKQYYAPWGLSFQVVTGDPRGIAPSGITVVLNGTDITSSLTIGGTPQNRSVTYAGLVPNTDYAGVITVRDPGGQQTVVNFSFDTQPAFALPKEFSFPTTAAVSSAPGMRARIVQANDSPVLPNTAERAEAQLAGTLIDPATGEPHVNLATPSSDNPDGSYNQQIINWNVEAMGAGAESGNFQAPTFPDEYIPGTVHNLNVAAEVLTYLQLSPGRYVMGVNSDDGFVVSSGIHHRDVLAASLGRFDGGRGASDTLFQFDVVEAGLYPFRLLYYQGGGQGGLEWFTVDPMTQEKILINNSADARSVRAWRQISLPERPYIASVQPSPGARDVEVDSSITVTIQDTDAQVQQSSVQMTINGQNVSPQVNKAGGVTTVTFTPAQKFAGDTLHTVALSYQDSASNQRSATFSFTTRFVPPIVSKPAKIVWVSFHAGDDEPSAAATTAGFTQAPDVEYTELLKAAGHEVTRYVTSATPDVAFLNTFDLVIISRSVPSGNYQSAESTALWHSLTSPTIVMGGYVLRASRLGYTTGETIPDTSGTIHLTVAEPSHPIFAGVPLDAANKTANAFARRVTFNGTLQRGISVNTSPIVAGAKILATVGTAGDAAFGGMIIGEFPAGTVMGNASADVTAGKRLVFLSGSREQGITAEGAGIYDLESDGARLFLNAVRYMAGLEDLNPMVPLSARLSATGEFVISWPAAGTDNFVLQSSASLSPANWQSVSEQPVPNGDQRTVTLQVTGSSRFFRLFRP